METRSPDISALTAHSESTNSTDDEFSDDEIDCISAENSSSSATSVPVVDGDVNLMVTAFVKHLYQERLDIDEEEVAGVGAEKIPGEAETSPEEGPEETEGSEAEGAEK